MRKPTVRQARTWRAAGLALGVAGLVGGSLSYFAMQGASADAEPSTATPIKHVVVLFDENQSFDHYFGTYPNAKNTDGTPFHAAKGTPIPDNYTSHPDLLTKNPNTVQPFRLTPDQAWTCSQNHGYTAEQKAVSGINADGTQGTPMGTFVQNTSVDNCSGPFNATGETMGYYDGNTVTGLWNYAQHYAMSDNSWADNFGPSTVGALNVVSGQTYGGIAYDPASDDTNPTPASNKTAGGLSAVDQTTGVGTVIGDPDPVYDDCADLDHKNTSNLVGMTGKNIGDLLNEKQVSWGYFAGGFTPTTPWDGQPGHYAKCDAMSANIAHTTGFDYNPHHNPFAYYKSTSNPHHLLPKSKAEIGHDGQANHQYDLHYFYDALDDGNLPAVSYVKPIYAEDGHPSNSDPIDEQRFLTRTINAIETSPYWSSTAIVIAYDDSDGWYDHVAPTIINGSNTSDDSVVCKTAANSADPMGGHQDRCGPSQRLPFLVISPFAKQNFVSHDKISQASIVKFIEDNWKLGTTIGSGSFDTTAGSILGMFDFQHPQQTNLLLNYDGSVKAQNKVKVKPAGGWAATVHGHAPKGRFGSPVTVPFTVTSDGDVAGGTVSFKLDGRAFGHTVTLSGPNGSVALPATLSAGTHRVEIDYAGSADVNAAKTVVTVSVAKAPASLHAKVTRPKHGKAQVTVTAPRGAAGTVSVKVNGKRAGAKRLHAGKATFTVKVHKGANKVVLTYGGSASYLPAATTLHVRG